MKTAVFLALFMLTECAIAQNDIPATDCIKKPGDKFAKLSWTAPTPNDNFSHYTVTHILPDGAEFVYIADSETSLKVPLLESGPHRFTVRTHTRDGEMSTPSTSVCKEV